MRITAPTGSRRPYASYRAARLRRAAALAVALAVIGGGLTALVRARRSAAALPGYWAWTPPTIADTSFAIPGGAVFVAPNGSDNNPGTQGAPLQTIVRAIAKAPAGGTVVLRGGIYRQQIGSVTKRITLQAYPHEKAWVKGSVVVTGFTSSGGAWVKTGWNPASVCDTCYPGGTIDPNYPQAGKADQTFIDGFPMRQVGSRNALQSGTFFADRANHALYVGSNPSGHTIESTVFDKALQFNNGSSGSVVRGIGFEHYAAHYNFDVPAMVVVNTSKISLVNDTFAFSASRGLSVLSTGAVVTDDIFVDNGMNAFHANAANGLDFERNVLQYNNLERFSIVPSASASVAAAKITSTGFLVIKRNVVEDNYGNGLWLDVSCFGAVVVDNTALRNAGHGIAAELSGGLIIAGNISASNGRIGLKISGSNAVEAWSNTLANNGWAQLGVYEDPRSNPHPSNGVTWDTANVRVANNILEAPSSSTYAVLDSFDLTNPHHATTQGMMSFDGRNLWMRPQSGAPRYVATWQISLKSKASYSSLSALQSATSREAGSVNADGRSLSSVFLNPGIDDFRLAGGSPARVSGVTLPSNVAAAMGVNPNVGQLGAINAPIG